MLKALENYNFFVIFGSWVNGLSYFEINMKLPFNLIVDVKNEVKIQVCFANIYFLSVMKYRNILFFLALFYSSGI